MMYGVGIPVLFPLAALALQCQWLSERIQLAYVNRMPPAIDDKLNNDAMKILMFSPLLLLFNGYWMLDNRQIFSREWAYVMREKDQMKSGHHPIEVFSLTSSYSTPLFLFAFISIVIITLQLVIPKKQQMLMGLTMARKEITVKEGLPNFFRVINISDRQQILNEY